MAMRPHFDPEREEKVPKPTSLKEVPGYLKTLVGGFFHRLFYMYRLVWDASPWVLFLMIFMSVFNGVTPVIGATIRAELINSLADAYVGMVDFPTIRRLLVFLFVYNFAIRIVHTVNNVINRISGDIVTNHIKLKIMNKAKTIDLASFDMPEFYAKLDNANREAGSRPMNILNSSFGLISTLISMVSFIGILWAINPAAPIIIIILAIPSAAVNFVYRAKNVDYIKQRTKDRREMGYFGGLVTNQHLVKEIKMFHLADTFIERYNTVFRKYFRGQKRLVVEEHAWHMAISIVTTTVNCLLFLYIANQVVEGNIQVGDYSLYTGALGSISGSVNNFINTTAAIYESTLFIDNMISFMEEECTIVPRLAEPVMPVRHTAHTIQLENVSFRYPGTERDVIKNVNLSINAGETLVLVGLNGAGKTTLIKLITRLYDPTEGRILLDGRDIRDYDVTELYRIFGIIFQDFGHYATTISENIHFGQIDREIDPEAVRDAARQSDADSFIETLPDQYDTPLMRIFEKNGTELSGGQWQKLAIARAFYGDSDILILDEPTAALDPMAEQEIFNEFDRLRQDKTTIFVSHRLSSATTASKIVVMEYGEVIEEGSHAELMAKKGRYHTLFTTQAQRYIENS